MHQNKIKMGDKDVTFEGHKAICPLIYLYLCFKKPLEIE